MKNTLIVILVVVILGLGYFFFMKGEPKTEMMTPEDTNNSSMGKLDINVVCDSALSYMTFPDGESSAKFVAECKEGKHPEVIEHYKAEMNLGEGATI